MAKDPPAAGASEALVGRWETRVGESSVELALISDGTFGMGSMSGRWSADAERLTLIGDKNQALTYRFRVASDYLFLSGGDLDEPVTFTRSSAQR